MGDLRIDDPAINTTGGMGRMLPNIPLTFAQFERELSFERIRDKFAASKLLHKTYPSLCSG